MFAETKQSKQPGSNTEPAASNQADAPEAGKSQRALPRRGSVAQALLVAWAVILVGSLTWPFLLAFVRPGMSFALRDMMVLPHPYLTHSSLGFGDLAARNAPQDAALAVAGWFMPATWFVAIIMVVSASVAAWVAASVARRARTPLASHPLAQAAAMTVAVWNPFVVERLLQGQWSIAVAAWLLPAVALSRGAGQLLAIWGCSLTPTGGLFALLTTLVTTRRPLPAGVAAVACAPWMLPSVVTAVKDVAFNGAAGGTATAASASAFSPRAEAAVGTFGSLLGLGGIWNGDAVPLSRSAGFACAGIALFIVLATTVRRIPRPLLILAGIGCTVPLLSWLVPGLMGWVVSTLPGGGLLRDAQKFLALAVPAFVVGTTQLTRTDLRGLVLVLAVLQVPDAPRALAALAPVEVSVPAVDHRGGEVFFPDRPALITRADGIPVVDPATKAMNVVESGELIVDGVVVDTASPRWQAANALFNDGPLDPNAGPEVSRYFSAPQVSVIARADGNGGFNVERTDFAGHRRPLAGLGLLLLWLLIPLAALMHRIVPRMRDAAH